MDSCKIHMFWVCTLLLCGGIQHVQGRPQPSAQDEPQTIPGPDGSIPGEQESGGIDSVIESLKKNGRVTKLIGIYWLIIDQLQSSGLWLTGENEDELQPMPGEEESGGIDLVIEILKKDGRVPKLIGKYWLILDDDLQPSGLWFIGENGFDPFSQLISRLLGSEGKDTEKENIMKAPLSSFWLILDDDDNDLLSPPVWLIVRFDNSKVGNPDNSKVGNPDNSKVSNSDNSKVRHPYAGLLKPLTQSENFAEYFAMSLETPKLFIDWTFLLSDNQGKTKVKPVNE